MIPTSDYNAPDTSTHPAPDSHLLRLRPSPRKTNLAPRPCLNFLYIPYRFQLPSTTPTLPIRHTQHRLRLFTPSPATQTPTSSHVSLSHPLSDPSLLTTQSTHPHSPEDALSSPPLFHRFRSLATSVYPLRHLASLPSIQLLRLFATHQSSDGSSSIYPVDPPLRNSLASFLRFSPFRTSHSITRPMLCALCA